MMDETVSACMAYLRDSSLSPNTLSSYERDIRQYLTYLKTMGITETRMAGKDVLINYIDSLTRLGKSPSTVSRCIASLRVFYRYLIRNGHIEGNPLIGIEAPKISRKAPKTLSENEVQTLMEIPGATGTKNIRDKVIMKLLYEAGLKVSELIALDVDNVDFDAECILSEEGRKKRRVPVKRPCLEEVSDYLVRSRPYLMKTSHEKSLFLNSSGKRFSRQGIWKIIKKYTRMAHLQNDISPYTLRHTLMAGLESNKEGAAEPCIQGAE